MPHYQAIEVFKDKTQQDTEQKISELFKDIFKVPLAENLPNDDDMFLLGAIKSNGRPILFAAKNKQKLDSAKVQAIAQEVLKLAIAIKPYALKDLPLTPLSSRLKELLHSFGDARALKAQAIIADYFSASDDNLNLELDDERKQILAVAPVIKNQWVAMIKKIVVEENAEKVNELVQDLLKSWVLHVPAIANWMQACQKTGEENKRILAEQQQGITQGLLAAAQVCQAKLPPDSDFAIYSLEEFADGGFFYITSKGFSTAIDASPYDNIEYLAKPISNILPAPDVQQVYSCPIASKSEIVLQDDKGMKVYAKLRVPSEEDINKFANAFNVLAIAEQLTKLWNIGVRLHQAGKAHLTPIIQEFCRLADFYKSKYANDNTITEQAIQDLVKFLDITNLYLENPTEERYALYKEWVEVNDNALQGLAYYAKLLMAQTTLAKTIAELPKAEYQANLTKLLESMANICVDEFTPAMIKGKPQTLDLDAIKKAKLAVFQLMIAFAQQTEVYLASIHADAAKQYELAIDNLAKDLLAQQFKSLNEVITTAKQMVLLRKKQVLAQTLTSSTAPVTKGQIIAIDRSTNLSLKKTTLEIELTELQQFKREYSNEAIDVAINKLIVKINKAAAKVSNTGQPEQKLIEIVEQTKAFLNKPTEETYQAYIAFANTVEGHSILWNQITGVMLLLAGLVLAAACGLVIAVSHGVALPFVVPVVSPTMTYLAAGAAGLAATLGIFSLYNGRRKGLAKAMHDCAAAATLQNSKSLTSEEMIPLCSLPQAV